MKEKTSTLEGLVIFLAIVLVFQLVWNYLGRSIFPFLPLLDYLHSLAILVILNIIGRAFRTRIER